MTGYRQTLNDPSSANAAWRAPGRESTSRESGVRARARAPRQRSMMAPVLSRKRERLRDRALSGGAERLRLVQRSATCSPLVIQRLGIAPGLSPVLGSVSEAAT
jgi:hypothetical protein